MPTSTKKKSVTPSRSLSWLDIGQRLLQTGTVLYRAEKLASRRTQAQTPAAADLRSRSCVPWPRSVPALEQLRQGLAQVIPRLQWQQLWLSSGQGRVTKTHGGEAQPLNSEQGKAGQASSLSRPCGGCSLLILHSCGARQHMPLSKDTHNST